MFHSKPLSLHLTPPQPSWQAHAARLGAPQQPPMLAEMPATRGWGTRARPPPASTPCQLTVNPLPATVCFRQCSVVSAHYQSGEQTPSIYSSCSAMVVLSEGWWGRSLRRTCQRQEGERTRMSQPIRLSLPHHPCHDHSSDEEAEVTTVKWLFSEAAEGKTQNEDRRLPRNGNSRRVVNFPQTWTSDFTIICMYFFQEWDFSCFQKIQNESHI